MEKYYSYIAKSLKDHGYYYGSCKDLDARIREHNKGKTRSIKGRRPFVLHYFETHDTRSEAVKRERFYKSIEGYHWLKSNGII